MTCLYCRSRDVVEISLELQAEKVTMHSCPTCEGRWWDKGGESVGLHSVLALVAAR